MYAYLLSPLKRRLLLELQESFTRHPVYHKIVPFIQNRFAFDERPQYGIVMKGGSVTPVQLAADHHLGTVVSHVMLAYFGQPVFPLEWVREDTGAIRANRNVMPTLPGVYYLEVLQAPTDPQRPGQFIIDPLLTVTDEFLLQFETGLETSVTLKHPPLSGTLRVWENRRTLLREGVDYTVDYPTGTLTLLTPYRARAYLTADYRYPVASIGPVDFYWNRADVSTLPGVVLAFGKRAKKGDKVGVVVYPDRVDTARAYGGRIDANFDLDVIARDSNQVEEIADYALMAFWYEKRSSLSFEGIEVMECSISGESEDVYDEAGDDYYYQASLSLRVQADWEVHVPLPLTISRVTPEPKPLAGAGLYFAAHPVIVGRNNDYERLLG